MEKLLYGIFSVLSRVENSIVSYSSYEINQSGISTCPTRFTGMLDEERKIGCYVSGMVCEIVAETKSAKTIADTEVAES